VLVEIQMLANSGGSDLQRYIEHRIPALLGAYETGIGAVTLRLDEERAAGDTLATTCEIRVKLLPSGIWVIRKARDAQLYAAIERAADGISRSLARMKTAGRRKTGEAA
jgi:ribosomal subunit interface protein